MLKTRLIGAVATLPIMTVGIAYSDETPNGSEALELPVVEVETDRLVSDPGSIATIAADTITDIAADHPAEILNTAPGVNIQMNAGQENLVAIRSPVFISGAAQGSFLFLENGVPTRAPAFGNVNALFEVHHEIAHSIEVVRGPGSVKYGSNAVHGMINLLSPVPDFGDDTISLSASTLDRYKLDAVLRGNDVYEGVNSVVGVSLQHDAGWRDDTGLDQQKLTASSSFVLGSWDVLANFTAFNLNQETAGFIEGTDAYKDDDLVETNPNPEAFRDAWSARANVTFEKELETGNVRFTPYAIAQRMIFLQHFLPNQSLEKNGHDSVGLLSRYEVEQGNVNWKFGVDAAWADGFIKETQAEPFGFFPGDSRFPAGIHYDYDVETLTFAAFAEAGWQLSEDVFVLAGLRAETHEYDYTTEAPVGVNGRFNVPADRTDNFDLITPKLGIVYSGLEDLELYANYARGERAPQASDLYRLQSQQVAGEVEVETLDSFEVGIRGELADGAVGFDLATYSMKKDNFFFRDADRLNFPFGKTDHWGVELAAFGGWDVEAGSIDWDLGVSYAEHTYDFDRVVGSASETITSGNDIDTAPNWLADAGLTYNAENWSVSLGIEHIGEYFTNAANTRDYPGHTVAHLRGSYDVSDNVQAFVNVRNLTDEAYADRADFAFGDERYFPGEPLNATFGLRISR